MIQAMRDARVTATAIRHKEYSSAQKVLSGVLWTENFIILAVQCFWVLSKSTPLAADNLNGLVFGVAPFFALLCLGLGASIHIGFRQALVRLEKYLHWSAALVFWGLILYALLKDPFFALIPLGYSMLPWSLAMSLALAANLATHLREDAMAAERRSFISPQAGILCLFLLWGGVLWLGAHMPVIPLLWAVSSGIHAIAAWFFSFPAKETDAEIPKSSRFLDTMVSLSEMLLWLLLIGLFQVAFSFNYPSWGALEDKIYLYLAPYYSLRFLLGLLIGLWAARSSGLLHLTHPLAVAAFIGSLQYYEWLSPIPAGYALAAFYHATRRQGPVLSALSCMSATLVWLFGLACFSFSGTLIAFKVSDKLVQPIHQWGNISLVVLGACYLIICAFSYRTKVYGATPPPAPFHRVNSLWIALLLLLCTLSPCIGVLVGTAWPPFVLPHAKRQVVDKPMGVCHANVSPTDPAAKALEDLGVQAIRLNFTWGRIQRTPGAWNDEPFEEELRRALGNERRAVGVFDYDNNAIEEDPDGKTRDHYIAPSDRDLFVEYVRHVVSRYKDRVHDWEIWNEPDISRFWTGTMEEFCDLARETAAAIRETDPSATILGTPMTGPFGVVTPRAVEMLHRSGALAQVDHPNGHLYLTNPNNYYNEYIKLIGTARRFGHPGSICISEMGSPDGGYYPWRSDDDGLAAQAIKAYTIGTNLGVSLMNWFCLRDDSLEEQAESPQNSELFFGLLRSDSSWKASAYAYQLFSRYCTRCEIRNDQLGISGGLASRQLRATLYRKENGESALVMWLEPLFEARGTVRVKLALGELYEAPVWRDIASGQSKYWRDKEIDVSEIPVVLTFSNKTIGAPVALTVQETPIDGLILLAVTVLLLMTPMRRFLIV